MNRINSLRTTSIAALIAAGQIEQRTIIVSTPNSRGKSLYEHFLKEESNQNEENSYRINNIWIDECKWFNDKYFKLSRRQRKFRSKRSK